jgi:16S rRNA (uracil1498-N3)-methyltransferase
MRIPRIFHPQPLIANSRITLDDNAARHVAKVLRLGPGAALILFDGGGGDYPATITDLNKRQVIVETGAERIVDRESPLHITLAQGISKGERMDYTIQKAVELGITRIAPITTERSVVNLKGERLEKKLAHWQGIIISACEQCGRNILPKLLPLQTLDSWLQNDLQGSGLLLDHRADSSMSSLQAVDTVTLLIGPEGGLSEQERQRAVSAGYKGLRLGPRVLRTETAALTVLAALQSRWGDLR